MSSSRSSNDEIITTKNMPVLTRTFPMTIQMAVDILSVARSSSVIKPKTWVVRCEGVCTESVVLMMVNKWKSDDGPRDADAARVLEREGGCVIDGPGRLDQTHQVEADDGLPDQQGQLLIGGPVRGHDHRLRVRHHEGCQLELPQAHGGAGAVLLVDRLASPVRFEGVVVDVRMSKVGDPIAVVWVASKELKVEDKLGTAHGLKFTVGEIVPYKDMPSIVEDSTWKEFKPNPLISTKNLTRGVDGEGRHHHRQPGDLH
ncbi:hypothetical protein HDV64DRAFT_290802 [Trichoderma sp. TUCIM 5745]